MNKPAAELTSKWLSVDDLTLHMRVSVNPAPSEETTIVMVHGLVVSSRYMLPTARHLAPYYRVYVPDLPGYGKSAKPDHILSIPEQADALASWMSAAGIEKATLVGNSLGCQIIANFVLRYPHRAQRTVLIGPTMDPGARSAHQEIGRWLLNLFGEPLSLYPVVMRDYLDMGFRGFIATFRYGLQDRIEEHLPNMHVPTLIVRGSRDIVVPQSWVEKAVELLPQGRLIVIPGAAHDVNYNAPRELARVIRVFISETADPEKASRFSS